MPTKGFPFVDDKFDPTTNPPEVRPGRENQRFPLTVPKPNVPADGFTRAGQKAAERLAEAANLGRREAKRIDASDVPAGFVRAIEAADADPAGNTTSMANGTLRPLPVDGGVLYVIDLAVNPMAVVPDPNNGRNALDQLARRRAPLPVIGSDAFGLPRLGVADATQFIDMCHESHAALGFFHSQVAAGKDYNDLVSIGFQGVHNPIVLVPTIVVEDAGRSMTALIVKEGNRRVAAAMRALAESTGADLSKLAAWSHHLYGPAGPELREMDADAVNAVRRAAMHGDLKGGVWRPASGTGPDVDAFEEKLSRSIKQRTAVRVRTIQARIIVGFDPKSLAPDIAGAPSPLEALVQQYVRSIHIAEAAQKQWTAEAQNINVIDDALRRAAARHQAAGTFQPMTLDEIDAVLGYRNAEWAGAVDGPQHPLRVAAKIFAEVCCDSHDATDCVRDAMKAFNVSVHPSKAGDNRARVAAERIATLSGIANAEGGLYKRTRATIERICRPKLFTACSTHPGGDTQYWWECLDMTVDDLVAQASTESAEGAALSDDDREARATSAGASGGHGPATRALLLLALFAQTMSPAATGATRGAQASPFQMTVSGLGATRGKTATTPELVMVRVASVPGGIAQLGEIVRAALAPTPELPANLLNPDFETDGDPSTAGLLTEAFLRSDQLGWTTDDDEDGDGVTPDVPATVAERYATVVSAILHHLERAHQEAAALDADEELAEEFRSHGIRQDPERDVQRMLTDLMTRASMGYAFAARSAS
jgi:hypothetical protein